MDGLVSADVGAPSFWAFVVAAVVVLGLAASGTHHRAMQALVNLGFCALVLGPDAGLAVSAGLVAWHLACRPGRWPAHRARLGTALLVLAAAFVWHKLPGSTDPATLGRRVLTGIGFSYVALRAWEYLRASAEGRLGALGVADTINYLIPFHMLAAGPIVAVADFARQPQPTPAPGPDGTLEAVARIAQGVFKKFVLADGLVSTTGLTGFSADGWYVLIEIQLYYLFIYLDFSAYSDIAVGIGRLIGVSTPENFHRPLTARNIIVFWERWHISLSQFIRRNVFIPVQLSGMRATGGRHPLWVASAAFGAAFVLCGLWHGLSPKFLLWGAMHALAMIVCNLYRHLLSRRLGREGLAAYAARPVVRIVATAVTFEFVALSLAFIAHPATAFLD